LPFQENANPVGAAKKKKATPLPGGQAKERVKTLKNLAGNHGAFESEKGLLRATKTLWAFPQVNVKGKGKTKGQCQTRVAPPEHNWSTCGSETARVRRKEKERTEAITEEACQGNEEWTGQLLRRRRFCLDRWGTKKANQVPSRAHDIILGRT